MKSLAGTSRQNGSALTVAVLVLLLLTLVVFAAMPAIIGEQRVSGNDLRAKLAQHVAETGLSHGREFLRVSQASLAPKIGEEVSLTTWAACGATEKLFPCGAVEPDRANSTLRSKHYRYRLGADLRSIDFPTPGKFFDGSGQDAGNFDATYDVGLLLCRMTETNDCATTAATATGTTIFTLVSRGAVDGEKATATVTESVGTFHVMNLTPNLPPITAAGTLTGLGSVTIVANPNVGGPKGISLWSRHSLDGSGGSWQTCQAEEYRRSGTYVDEGKNKNVWTCDDCDCKPGDQTSHGNPGSVEGEDFLDSDNTDGGLAEADDPYYFPCDLFEYSLGIKVREDTNGNDVCETVITSGGDPAVPDIEEWLGKNAQTKTCGELNSSSAGLIWIKEPCTGGSSLGGTIGSADKPVFLVVDGSLKLQTSLKLYGFIFMRYTGSQFEQCVAGTGTDCPEISGGGGGASVYGSIVMEGGGKMNATVDVVYMPGLVDNFNNSNPPLFAGLPGSWHDRVAY